MSIPWTSNSSCELFNRKSFHVSVRSIQVIPCGRVVKRDSVCVCVCLSLSLYMTVCILPLCVNMCVCVCMYVCLCIYVCVCVCVYMCVCVCVFVRVWCVYVYLAETCNFIIYRLRFNSYYEIQWGRKYFVAGRAKLVDRTDVLLLILRWEFASLRETEVFQIALM